MDLHNFLQSPRVMGILNCTPDSFYDGGRYASVAEAYDHAMNMIDSGADIIDVGGESTRPFATEVSLDEELDRVIPVIERIRSASNVTISIDTYKSLVMQHAVAAGANMINDIMALQHTDALQIVSKLNVPVCIMHMQGKPSTMQNNPSYEENLINTINGFFAQRITACEQAGITKDRLILDPGFGFGKTFQHNMSIVKHLTEFNVHNIPLLLGVSRKSSLSVVGDLPELKLSAGLTLHLLALMHGVNIVRTHDVGATRASMLMLESVLHAS